MSSETLTAVGTLLSAVAAFLAVVVSIIVYRGQSALSSSIASEQARVALRINESQTRLSQRQLLLPLWQYISTLSNIDPESPITKDILRVVNTLELVALSCEGEMVDAQVIRRTFRDLYLKLYDQIQAVRQIPGLKISGMELLRQNPAAMAFYDQLRREHLDRDRIRPGLS